MLPEGWKLRTVSDVGSVITGSTPKTSDETLYDGPVPFVSPADLGTGRPVTSTSKTLTEKGFATTRRIRKGSTLFTCIGSTIGKIGLAGVDLATNQQINSVVPNSSHDDKFIYYALALRSRHIAMLAGKQAVPIINKSMFSDQPILTPPLPEQKKIAQILSTWDNAISATERLLENSQQRKKALMQQLLTGKKRLPGFEGEWVKEHLIDIVKIETGSSKSAFVNDNGSNFIIDMGSVTRSGRLNPTKKTSLDGPYLITGQLVMPKDDIGGGNIIGRVGVIPEDNKYILADHVYALTSLGPVDSHFLGYLINSDIVNKSLRRKANGTAQLGLGRKDVEKQEVLIPADIVEQQAIANVLTTAEQEIDALQKRIGHLKQEKKALMQQLLTGKRRVQVGDAA